MALGTVAAVAASNADAALAPLRSSATRIETEKNELQPNRECTEVNAYNWVLQREAMMPPK